MIQAQTLNRSLTEAVRPRIRELDRFVADPAVTAFLSRAGQEVLALLEQNPAEAAVAVTVPLQDLPVAPPSFIQTLRMAAFRPGLEMERERHPNSFQFLYCIEGTGETRVLRNGVWEADSYGSDRNEAFENRWHAVPDNTWHQSVATGSASWILATFHTAQNVQDEYEVPICPSP
ncbi:MAG: hypothetical protein M3O22_05240 [Pseudomonadota bacterium]|nr:hypothetical protein [Pseudomonadota bacterium]